MEKRITYIAYDGTEFQYEGECEAYEDELKNNEFQDVALLFDCEGKPLPLTERAFEETTFIYCKTDEAATFLQEKFHSMVTPWWTRSAAKKGCWLWGFNNSEDWIPAEEYLDRAKILQDILTK